MADNKVILDLVNGLVCVSALILLVSLRPLWLLIKNLPSGSIRSLWRLIGILIFLFIIGYISYATIYWRGIQLWLDLVVPMIFFCGAIFVFMVCSLSLKTSRDLMQIHNLQQENITDHLMGIYNRRFLELQFLKELEKAKRYKMALSVFLLDIDHFKKFNDKYGHLTGDLVLRRLGKFLLSSLRDSDIIARYGGEEVMIILPNTDISHSVLLAERLRKEIEDLEVEVPVKKHKNAMIHITVSIGVAKFDESTKYYEKLIEHADTALYQAKENGRNQVQVYSNPEKYN